MKLFVIFLFTFFLLLFVTSQGKVYGASAALADKSEPRLDHTRREEIEGKEILEKLQAKQLECKNLTDNNFELLGEYFMGQMMGNSHEAMNKMMEQMMGKEGETQMHIAMGKRNSGCDTSFITMMGSGFGNMMGGWGGFGILGWITMLVFWLLLILGVVALIRYLGGSRKRSDEDKKKDLT